MNKINASQYVDKFLKWLKSDKKGEPEWMMDWEEERKKRRAWYSKKLSKKGINSLTEEDFAKLIKELWATLIWSNKDYKVKKLLEDNSFPKIKEELKDLLYGMQSLDKRWDKFRISIKGLGPSSMSEILTFADPDKYGIVNLKPLSLLPILGVISESEFKKYSYYSLNGKRYVSLLANLSKIRQILQKYGLKKADFIATDFFIAYLFYNVFELYRERDKAGKIKKAIEDSRVVEKSVKPIVKKSLIKIKSHEEAECILLRLGLLLGFDTYTPDKSKKAFGKFLSEYATLKELPPFTHEDFLKTVKEIDVIWFKDEFPEVCFEVEHTTGVALGLLRLYHIRRFNAGLYIVAPKKIGTKYVTEVNKEPFRQIKNRYKFRSYKDLADFYSLTKHYSQAKEGFLEKRES